jgi:CIC family chloride channel protein
LVLALARRFTRIVRRARRRRVLAATTQGPISTVVLMMELTGHYRSFILPVLLIVVVATLVARTIEPRSIYDARLTDHEIAERQKLRELT